MNQNQLLTQIQAINLIAVDLQLFLDTHSNDAQALKDYQNFSKQYQDLKSQYEKQYGPLSNFGSQSSIETYNWVNGPWPWQNK